MIKINIKFLIFLILVTIFAYLGGGDLPYSLFYSGLSVFVFGLIHIILQGVTMKVNLNIDTDVFKTGDILGLNVAVKSFSIIPAAYILVKNGVVSSFKKNYNGEVTLLNFRKEKYFLSELELKVRGVYDFSVTDVLFTDLFCIIKVKKKFVKTKYIRVYPKVYRINETFFNGRSIATSEDSNEIRDLRLYREGDSLKKVHWKLSAKHNELYVKNFVESTSKDTNIILNMNKGEAIQKDHDLIEEQMIDLTVSLITYLQTKKFQIKLFINNEDEKIFNVGNQSEFQYLMEYFLNHKSKGKVELSDFLDSKIVAIKPKSWIGIITLVVDEVLKNKIIALTNNGFNISVFYCGNNNLEFINDQKTSGLEFIKCDKAIFSLEE